MFELETCVLEDRQFTKRVTWTLHGVRVFSYAFIVYAFYGYIENALFVFDVAPLAGGVLPHRDERGRVAPGISRG